MKRKPAEFKRLAREVLTRHYGVPMGAMVVSQLILFLLSVPFSWNITVNSSVREWVIYYVATVAISLLGIVFSIGTLKIVLSMARQQPYAFTDLFYGFSHHPDRYILTAVLLFLLCIIPALPFVAVVVLLKIMNGFALKLSLTLIAGVIMIAGEIYIALSYALIYFLLLDHSEMRIVEAFRESKRMMKGNKGRMFYLVLTFIGFWVLGILSLGIGFLWIGPYQMETTTFFYLELTGEFDAKVSYEEEYQQKELYE